MTKNSSSNRAVVPEAKGALDRFKFEVANELGVPLSDGYNWKPDFQTERKCWGIYGQKNDRTAGKTDVRQFSE